MDADGILGGGSSSTSDSTGSWDQFREDHVSLTSSGSAGTKQVTTTSRDAGTQSGHETQQTTESAGGTTRTVTGTLQTTQAVTFTQSDGQSSYRESTNVTTTDTTAPDGTVIRGTEPTRGVTGTQTQDFAAAYLVATLGAGTMLPPAPNSGVSGDGSNSPDNSSDEAPVANNEPSSPTPEGAGTSMSASNANPGGTTPNSQASGNGAAPAPAAAPAPSSGGITGILQELWGTFLSLRDQLVNLTAEERDAALDVVGTALDIGGIFEPTPFCDLSSTALAGYRQDYWGAGLSLLGVIPYLGDTAKLGKIPQYLNKISNALVLAGKNARCAAIMEPVFNVVHKLLDAVPLNRLPESVSKRLIRARDDIKDFLTRRCFAAGTPLLTPDGSKPIEAFRPGDWVLSAPEDDPDAPVVPRIVEEVFEAWSSLLELRVGSVAIRTSPEHPFWVEGRGWTSADELVEGDRLHTYEGDTVILGSVTPLPEMVPVYNLRVQEYHTYFVGSRLWGFAVWAHNSYEGSARGELLEELTRSGVKHTPENVVGIGRAATGRVVFLEAGSSRAGLQHIVERHADDFAARGIAEAQIPDAVMTAVTRGKEVGQVGSGKNARVVYEFEYLGKTQRIAVGEASNGFIVTAHPVS